MLNQVTLQGRLVKDPIISVVGADTKLGKASLAVERDYKDKSTGKRAVDFISIEAWRNVAGFLEKYLHKGEMVIVRGRLQTGSWEDRVTGEKKFVTKVVAESFYLVPNSGKGSPDMDSFAPDLVFKDGNDYSSRVAQSENQGGGVFHDVGDEEELPF